MRRTTATFVALASCFLVALAGCGSSATVDEPQGDYVEMRPLIYDYGTVFDCVAEAISEEGLPVRIADRDKGAIVTEFVPGDVNRLDGTQQGSRVKARVVKVGAKDFIVRMAATKLVRDVKDENHPGEWRYAGRDPDLLDRLKKRFDKQVDKRYRASPDRGG